MSSSDTVTQERRKQPLVQNPALTVNSTSCTQRTRNILHRSRNILHISHGCFPEEIESTGRAWHVSLHTGWPASVHSCAISLWFDSLLELSPASMFFLWEAYYLNYSPSISLCPIFPFFSFPRYRFSLTLLPALSLVFIYHTQDHSLFIACLISQHHLTWVLRLNNGTHSGTQVIDLE